MLVRFHKEHMKNYSSRTGPVYVQEVGSKSLKVSAGGCMRLLYHDCADITGHCEACPGGPCLRINVAYAMRNTEAAASWSESLFVVLINDGSMMFVF